MWLSITEQRLRAAVAFFGADRELSSIRPSDVKQWMTWLRQQKRGKRNRPLGDGTVRHYINALSNLYRTAQEEEAVPPGYNPVAALRAKPAAKRGEARWFEVHDAALILEAARHYRPARPDLALPFIHPLIACFLLSGGRRSEVFGLETEDISFDRNTVTFRSNEWRRLKTDKSNRVVPLWPQLAETLVRYIASAPPGRLLFPGHKGGHEQMIWSIDKVLDAISVRIGLTPGAIRAQMFRNTYCAARLQTLDRGQPISVYTVSRELGHTSTDMVQRIYAHLGEVRHRSEAVEYRAEQHADVLGERLSALRARWCGDSRPARVVRKTAS
jgi:integrase